LRLLPEPKVPGGKYRVLDSDKEGYDDGGVGDLTLIIDLDDCVLRRRRGESDYFAAVKTNILPRVSHGQMAHLPRREQKVQLATLLFSDGDANADDDEDSDTPSEVYVDTTNNDDEEKKYRRKERLGKAKQSLKLSFYLSEPACAAMSLTEISKRTLLCFGKDGAEGAFRCAKKALEMSGEGYYDSEQILIEVSPKKSASESVSVVMRHHNSLAHSLIVFYYSVISKAEDEPKALKYEPNATSPALANPTSLKFMPLRASVLCKRAAYLHAGNALQAQSKFEEAREYYQNVLPLLEPEPRCCRIDWERSSALINIGDTYSRENNFDKACEFYDKAEQLGKDHLDVVDGNHTDGKGIMMVARKARAFALKRAGKDDEAKALLREVLSMTIEFNKLTAKEKLEMKEELAGNQAEAAVGASGTHTAAAADSIDD
jgi:tetratricopeptide (TPR) repeat protein